MKKMILLTLCAPLLLFALLYCLLRWKVYYDA